MYRWHWQVRSHLEPFGLTKALDLLDQSQYWPRGRLDDERDRKLRELVVHFHARSPGYRRLMDEAGVKPAQVRGVADIGKLPVLHKELLRERIDELRVLGMEEKDLERGVTGGTTGNPMRVVRDRAGTAWQRGCYWRGFGWGGLRLGEPWVQIFGGAMGLTERSTKERLRGWFAGKVFLHAFELGAETAPRFVAEIRESGARHLVGYASSCHLLAQHVERSGESLSFEAVFPTAELLPSAWAATMARVFGAKVLPYYGCGEVQSLAYSCPTAAEPVYHTCDEHAVIEVERSDGSAALLGEGAFLLTDLDNRALPLIRYRNGDAGVLAEPGCACGRTLGRITRLDGRVNDVLITTSGDAISGVIGTHSFRVVNNVAHFQIVQERPGQARIRIVRAPGFDPAVEEPKLRTIFSKNLGATAQIELEYVDEIARTAAGKARLVINQYLEAKKAAAERPPQS